MSPLLASIYRDQESSTPKFYEGIFHTIFNSSKEGIIIAKNGVIVDYNNNFLEMFDLSPEDLKGKAGIDYIPKIQEGNPTTRDEIIEILGYVFNGNGSRSFEWSHIKKDNTRFYCEISLSLYIFNNAKYIIAIVHDITKIRNTQEELRQKNLQLTTALENSQIGLWDWNLKTGDFFHDKIYYSMLGYDKAEIDPDFDLWKNCMHKDDYEEVNELLEAHKEGLTPTYESTFRLRSKNGEWRCILDRGKAVERDQDGKAIHIIGTHQDITKQMEIDYALQKSEKNYRTLVETSKDLIFKLNLEGDLVYYNKATRDRLNIVSIENKSHLNLYDIVYHEDIQKAKNNLELVSKGKHLFGAEFRIQDSKKNILYIQISSSPIYNSSGKIDEILVTGRDITGQREAEMLLENNLEHLAILKQDLEVSLREKRALLREIQHRVKNNLQILSAITIMHENSASTEKEKNFLKDFQQRISAISKIHETLYRSEDLGKMNLFEYIPDLVKNLILSYNIDKNRIKVNFSIEKLIIGLNSAMHIGLIVNELVSNAFKYAFPRKMKGEILIKVKTTDDEKIILQVKDNGIGFPEEIDFHKSNSMGLRIIRTSIKQLKGEILLEKDNGTNWVILFDRGKQFTL